jgi:hypothetical protein
MFYVILPCDFKGVRFIECKSWFLYAEGSMPLGINFKSC